MTGAPTSRVSILGASGYVGGELLRLLLQHPGVEVAQVTSERSAGQFVHFVHPNLRGLTPLQFVTSDELERCDVLFSALPHGQLMARIDELSERAERIVDLSADFRLRGAEQYERWYGREHAAPAWLDRFVYGLPEVHREELCGARYASGVGCNATATNLALLPLVSADLVDWSRGCVVEVKVGSSEGGNKESLATHHPERSSVVRSFAPVGHRHTAEVEQVFGAHGVRNAEVHLSATAIDLVRGVLATAHVFLQDGVQERDVARAVRGRYRDEPFVRVVKQNRGVYRYPEPKLLWGSNYADVGWAVDEERGRLVMISAIDNLMKGAAGSAVQSMNLMLGLPEVEGLGFPGLHPI
ncbi:MAG: N-acetyl-gamma-glutamyl-phosphate reductase [Acidobacteriota bacterium]